jgi:formyl-CoA transferase
MNLVGGDGLGDDPRYATNTERVKRADEVDTMVADWIAARTLDEVVDAFEKVEAAIGPAYDAAQIIDDPQYRARDSVTTVADADLGPLKMQNVFPVMSRTPGRIKHAGARLAEHQKDVLAELVGSGKLSPDIGKRLEAMAENLRKKQGV